MSTATRGYRLTTIEGFAFEAATAPGLLVHNLAPMTVVQVHTRNSHYRMVVAPDGGVLVQGGPYFPDPTPARLAGATIGGSLLKIGWILRGLPMELTEGGRRIVTSPVYSVAVEPEPRGSVH